MAPEEPAAYRSLAMLRGREGRWLEARGLLRLCACLEGVQGGAASMYVAACLNTGRAPRRWRSCATASSGSVAASPRRRWRCTRR
ncbi:hypothetical protein [Nannocystis pusilla]|uniref:hypothetical protein n=1 Tax=Nannocystis pusilla TaxID=889268 RepID=UPI003B7E9AF2